MKVKKQNIESSTEKNVRLIITVAANSPCVWQCAIVICARQTIYQALNHSF